MPLPIDPVEVCYSRLARAGWTVREIQISTADGPYWLVTGRNGTNTIEAYGATQAYAWELACAQAKPIEFHHK
jgi:hypothetical protein